MTKAEIVNEVAKATGIEKVAVQTVVEATMESIKGSLIKGNPVYLRGTMTIPAHDIPAFKPAKSFVAAVKTK